MRAGVPGLRLPPTWGRAISIDCVTIMRSKALGGATGVLLVVGQCLSVVFLVLALFAPSYHRKTMAIPGGNTLTVQLSLFRVTCTSDCTPFFANAPFLKRPLGRGADVKACRRLVELLNGMSLRELAQFLCGFVVLLLFRIQSMQSVDRVVRDC